MMRMSLNVLCGESFIVHKEKVDIAGVVDEESLVAGRHHVASLLVRSESNLHVPSADAPHLDISKF